MHTFYISFRHSIRGTRVMLIFVQPLFLWPTGDDKVLGKVYKFSLASFFRCDEEEEAENVSPSLSRLAFGAVYGSDWRPVKLEIIIEMKRDGAKRWKKEKRISFPLAAFFLPNLAQNFSNSGLIWKREELSVRERDRERDRVWKREREKESKWRDLEEERIIHRALEYDRGYQRHSREQYIYVGIFRVRENEMKNASAILSFVPSVFLVIFVRKNSFLFYHLLFLFFRLVYDYRFHRPPLFSSLGEFFFFIVYIFFLVSKAPFNLLNVVRHFLPATPIAQILPHYGVTFHICPFRRQSEWGIVCRFVFYCTELWALNSDLVYVILSCRVVYRIHFPRWPRFPFENTWKQKCYDGLMVCGGAGHFENVNPAFCCGLTNA